MVRRPLHRPITITMIMVIGTVRGITTAFISTHGQPIIPGAEAGGETIGTGGGTEAMAAIGMGVITAVAVIITKRKI